MSLEAAALQEMQKLARFPRVWLDSVGNVEPPAYLVKGVLEARSIALVYGPSGEGKSFFTADLAGHIAAGIPWRGRRVKQGLVAYIAAEAGASIVRRFAAWRDQVPGEAREESVPLAILTRGANLLDLRDAEALLEELTALQDEAGAPLSLVVIDTLSRSIPGGDENSAETITHAVAVADRIRDELGATCLFVHHSGKDATKGARGHSALFAAADTVIRVADHVATVEKARDGESGASFGFRLEVVDLGTDQDGDPITTCVVVPEEAEKKPKPARLPGAAKVALDALKEAIEAHGERLPGSSTIPPGVLAVGIEHWRARFRLRYGSDDRDGDAIKKAFQRAREHLLREQLVCISDPWAWPT